VTSYSVDPPAGYTPEDEAFEAARAVLLPAGTIDVHSPRGKSVRLHYREETSDLATIGSTFRLWGSLVDEYQLADLHSDGLMVDVGGHIGSVCIAYLVDNPEARAVAVEPLPENVEMIRTNAQSAGVSDRLSIVAGAFGTTSVAYGHTDHRYIGNIGGANGEVVTVEEITLTGLIAEHGPVSVLKTDCEGGEWALLADPAVADVPLIVGEYHTFGPVALHALLDATHDVTAGTEPTGNFRAVRR
jgi:FkbM family methyltransferase